MQIVAAGIDGPTRGDTCDVRRGTPQGACRPFAVARHFFVMSGGGGYERRCRLLRVIFGKRKPESA
jgi:hypothetical protein